MIGTKLAHYEITSHIGSGGMGDVYQATDTKLGRSVAIKFLPEAFSHDTERVAQFQREARVLASLNHPNIAAIYGVEEINGRHFLVMELVPGETLADRIKRGAIPIEETLPIAKQVAEALEEAHEKGIIHRDLKPANIKLTPDVKVKVLDFGLAKAFEQEPANAALSQSPTLSIAATNAGVILGTAAYMSPEQAKGRRVDKSTDIFAFGCLLYEMLTGCPAFEGEDIPEILSRVLQREPDWALLPANVPPRTRELVRLCLQKDIKNRRSDAADVRIDIEQVLASPAAAQATPLAQGSRLAWIVTGALALVAVVLAIPAVRHLRETSAPALPEMRLEISTPPTADPASIAISPDGEKIVFIAASEGQSKLWLRRLDSVSGRALAGTDGASFPFWSPDSQFLGFFAEAKLKRVDIDRGSVQILADAPDGRGGAWNRDGTIIFTPNSTQSSIFRISATSGAASVVTRTDTTKETSHRFPQFLPDGRHFLYYAQGISESHGIYVSDLDGLRARRLLDVDSAPIYESSGHLFFVRQGTLFAQEFDVARLELKGNPFSVAERIATFFNAQGSGAVSASSAGSIIYRTASQGGRRQFLWLDRSGKEIGKASDPLDATSVSISRDGRRVGLGQLINNNIDVQLLDLGRNVLSRFTFDDAVDNECIWSPNDRQIAFRSNRKGAYDLYIKPATGPGSEELLWASGHDKRPVDWSPDGRFLLYADLDPRTGVDIWALPMDGDRKPFPVVRTNFDEDLAQFSPDGRWIAYQSNESGRYEIYIRPFPGPGDQIHVSTKGGAQVRWRRDGKELFYIALDGWLMAVPIRIASNAQTIEAGSPVPLFATRVGPAVYPTNNEQYDISSDGQRFLMNTIIEQVPSPITVILNWKAKL